MTNYLVLSADDREWYPSFYTEPAMQSMLKLWGDVGGVRDFVAPISVSCGDLDIRKLRMDQGNRLLVFRGDIVVPKLVRRYVIE